MDPHLTPPALHCKICDGVITERLRPRETMHGLDETFDYGLCADCGCLQALAPPADLSRYYPQDYYSFSSSSKNSAWKRLRRGFKRRLVLSHPALLTPALRRWLAPYPLFWLYREMGLTLAGGLLDVGAGGGAHVRELRSAGVAGAVGVDAFLPADVVEDGAVLVQRGQLADVDGNFDVITFHHSFEHIADPHETLRQARAHLKPGGQLLIRIPTVSSDAFDTYREQWCQLDAPRHLFLHSHRSIRLAAERAGLEVVALSCDSSELQFIASEQNRRGIALMDPRSYAVDKRTSLFTSQQVQGFKRQAEAANKALRGDQVCVILAPRPGA